MPKQTPLCLTLPQPSRSLELRRGCRFGIRPVWGVTTSIPHSYICQSLLPPVCSCSDLCGCIGGGQSERRPPFYSDSCAYDTVVGFGPVYLRSVISESLKRLGQFRGDKWWTGRTADVGTQTFKHDGLNWGWSPSLTVHPIIYSPQAEVSPEQPVHTSHSITLIKTNDKEWLLGFHNVFCIIKLVNCIAQNKWAE